MLTQNNNVNEIIKSWPQNKNLWEEDPNDFNHTPHLNWGHDLDLITRKYFPINVPWRPPFISNVKLYNSSKCPHDVSTEIWSSSAMISLLTDLQHARRKEYEDFIKVHIWSLEDSLSYICGTSVDVLPLNVDLRRRIHIRTPLRWFGPT